MSKIPNKVPKSRVNVWLMTDVYYPEQTSTGFILTQIAEALTKNFLVKVITGPATNLFKSVRKQRNEKHNGVEIFRCWGTSFNRTRLLYRLLNMLTRSISIFLNGMIRCKHGDIILVVTNPPLLPLAVFLISIVKKISFVLLIHDVYPEVVVATGLCKEDASIIKLGQYINGMVYRHASRIITLGRDMTEAIKHKVRCDAAKIFTIPNWAETDIVYPQEKEGNTLLSDLNVTVPFVVLYAGNLGYPNGVEYLAEACRQLNDDNQIHFIFVGDGVKAQWFRDYIQQHQLLNVSFVRSMPRSEQVVFLNSCDVSLVALVPGMLGLAVPSRLYNYMAAGKPIIGMVDHQSEVAKVIEEEKIGWVVPPGDVKALVATIKSASRAGTELREMGARANKVSSSKYSFSIIAGQYIKLFRDLACSK